MELPSPEFHEISDVRLFGRCYLYISRSIERPIDSVVNKSLNEEKGLIYGVFMQIMLRRSEMNFNWKRFHKRLLKATRDVARRARYTFVAAHQRPSLIAPNPTQL